MEASEAAKVIPAGISMEGRKVLVTGAASGIGRATVVCLAELGADLVITDISPMDEVSGEAEAAGAKVTAIGGDLIDDDFLDGLMEKGPYDALAAVAGVFTPPAGMGSKEGFNWVLEVNLRAPMRLASACVDQMGERGGGNIVLVGSAAGRNGGAVANDSFEYAAYAGSKGGVHAVVRWLARRGAPHNVVVNGVAPGPVETPLSAGMTFNAGSIPIGRMGKPAELGWPIAFLCSPAASFAVGAVLDVNAAPSLAEEGLAELRDRERIASRLVAYSTALDDKDWALVEESFAAGGVVDYLEYGGEQSGATIVEHLRGGLGGLDTTQHLVANFAIDLDGDVARSVCALQARHILGPDCYTLVGRYEDRLAREADGAWRLTHRTLRVSFTEGDPEVFVRGVERLVAAGGEDAELAARWRDSVTLG